MELPLLRWLLPRWRRPTARRVVMYTRRGCHLCEEAWEYLRQEQRSHGFVLEACDVDEDAELTALYGEQVPVVAIDGKVRFRGRINPVLWDRLMRREASS
jgi:glutaredoxin